MALGVFALVIILGLVVVTKTLLHTPRPFDDIAAVDIQLDEANLAANLAPPSASRLSPTKPQRINKILSLVTL